MTKRWELGSPPEFPSDPTKGWAPFRQRWHQFITILVDAVRRLFLQVQADEERIDTIEATPFTDGDKGDVTVSGAGAVFTLDIVSAFGRTLIDDAAASDGRTTLGLGTVAILASDTDGALAANSDTVVATQKATKTYADTKQTLDALLTAIAALTTAADQTIYSTGVDAVAMTSFKASVRSLAALSVVKGDLYLGSAANTVVLLGVGGTGFPLIVTGGTAIWATTQPTFPLHQIDCYVRPLFNATASADPAVPTLAATDVTLSDANDADGWRGGKNFVDASITWIGGGCLVPTDLDVTKAVDAKIICVLLGNASSGDVAEFTCIYRTTQRQEAHLTGGATGRVDGTTVLTSHVTGDTAQCSITAAIPANTLVAGDWLNITIERDARSTNADDTYANTLVVIGILLEGKRKLWS